MATIPPAIAQLIGEQSRPIGTARHGDRGALVDRICASTGQSRATVYRQLEKLERQGSVHKVTTDEGAYYQFCTHGCASDCCLFKCERCGRIVHLDCHQLAPLYEHLEHEHGFSINPRKTMFYGLCRECQEGA